MCRNKKNLYFLNFKNYKSKNNKDLQKLINI
ncbi:MAG: hypothetical protein RL090_479 [Bacteroidota bacterium]